MNFAPTHTERKIRELPTLVYISGIKYPFSLTGEPRSRSIVLHMMVTQKQSLPSFSSFLSVLSILFYCAGFLRVELELNEQKKRINALENNAKTDRRPSNERSVVEITKTRSSRKFFFFEISLLFNFGDVTVLLGFVIRSPVRLSILIVTEINH